METVRLLHSSNCYHAEWGIISAQHQTQLTESNTEHSAREIEVKELVGEHGSASGGRLVCHGLLAVA